MPWSPRPDAVASLSDKTVVTLVAVALGLMVALVLWPFTGLLGIAGVLTVSLICGLVAWVLLSKVM